ncbi:PAS domain-containing protein [Sphingomonas sp.]|uniref:PAS domain-containing protein n=1 Tax=Sphingomonas sp. TaxID=28214 RepID=UPI0025ED6B11|nr:PAS domain-containing protein [Sphingomonas sp.]
MPATQTAQDFLDQALDALRAGNECFRPVLDAIPAPVYLTDADGMVTYWNQACVDFAGREPELGKDRWCVTWQIQSMSDEPVPHDRCPMAVAIKERREVRDEVAIAMRPDGTRRAFTPYPTPLFDDQGELTCAVNLLVDVTEEQAVALSVQAKRCQRLAAAISDRQTSDMLNGMAKGYEANAAALRQA